MRSSLPHLALIQKLWRYSAWYSFTHPFQFWFHLQRNFKNPSVSRSWKHQSLIQRRSGKQLLPHTNLWILRSVRFPVNRKTKFFSFIHQSFWLFCPVDYSHHLRTFMKNSSLLCSDTSLHDLLSGLRWSYNLWVGNLKFARTITDLL